MPRSIRNDNRIIIDRKVIIDGAETTQQVDVGSYYFEASIGLTQLSIQFFLNEEITNVEELKQIEDLYIREYANFAQDSTPFGWDMLKKVNINEM